MFVFQRPLYSFYEKYVNDQIFLFSSQCGYGAANHGIFTVE